MNTDERGFNALPHAKGRRRIRLQLTNLDGAVDSDRDAFQPCPLTTLCQFRGESPIKTGHVLMSPVILKVASLEDRSEPMKRMILPDGSRRARPTLRQVKLAITRIDVSDPNPYLIVEETGRHADVGYIQTAKTSDEQFRVEYRKADGNHYAASDIEEQQVKKLFASFMTGDGWYLQAVEWDDVTEEVNAAIRQATEDADNTPDDSDDARTSIAFGLLALAHGVVSMNAGTASMVGPHLADGLSTSELKRLNLLSNDLVALCGKFERFANRVATRPLVGSLSGNRSRKVANRTRKKSTPTARKKR